MRVPVILSVIAIANGATHLKKVISVKSPVAAVSEPNAPPTLEQELFFSESENGTRSLISFAPRPQLDRPATLMAGKTTKPPTPGISASVLAAIDDAYGCDKISQSEWSFLNLTNAHRASLNKGLNCLKMQKTVYTTTKLHSVNFEIQGGSQSYECCTHSWLVQASMSSPIDGVTFANGCYDCRSDGDYGSSYIMWSKIQEIFQSPSMGVDYEIALAAMDMNVSAMPPQQILDAYLQSPAHRDVIEQNSWWEGYYWTGVGISISNHTNFVVFTDVEDSLGFCDSPQWVYEC